MQKRFQTFLLLLIGIMLACPAMAQGDDSKSKKRSKKLQAMMEWQEQQEKQEAYDKVVDDAHRLFQMDRYQQAQGRYRDALEIFPDDQVATAKITDIQLVMDSLANLGQPLEPLTTSTEYTIQETETPSPTHDLVGSIIVPAKPATNKAIEEAEPAPPRPPKTLEELLRNLPIRRPDITGLAETTPVEPKPEPAAEPVPEPTPTPAPKPTPTLVKAKPVPSPPKTLETMDKSTPEFQAELARMYNAGWTVEERTEGSKHMVRKVYVENNKGTEYLRVKHAWGGLYFFRNGTPVTQAIWQTETAGAGH